MRSMTGFGRATRSTEEMNLVVELTRVGSEILRGANSGVHQDRTSLVGQQATFPALPRMSEAVV